jgi:hypothetical protein
MKMENCPLAGMQKSKRACKDVVVDLCLQVDQKIKKNILSYPITPVTKLVSFKNDNISSNFKLRFSHCVRLVHKSVN